ncbi:MAG: hypothetical protein WBB45_11455 [Cyclobacteriaceae bacterium]
MAVIEKNPWIKGARGMVMDSIVYRQRAGRTIVSAKPRRSARPPSEKQLQHRERFREASRYAKGAARHAIKGPLYAKQADGFNSAYNIALKDYLKAPVIHEVDLNTFRGRRGDILGVYAEDNFGIAELKVSLINEAGEILAYGRAEEVIDNTYFTYRLTTDLPVGDVRVLRAEARDHAGNITVHEEVMDSMNWEGSLPRIGSMQKAAGRVYAALLLVVSVLLFACGSNKSPASRQDVCPGGLGARTGSITAAVYKDEVFSSGRAAFLPRCGVIIDRKGQEKTRRKYPTGFASDLVMRWYQLFFRLSHMTPSGGRVSTILCSWLCTGTG